MGRLVERDLDVPAVQELARRLDEHVRHAERVLFPLVEQSIPDALAKLSEHIAAAERV